MAKGSTSTRSVFYGYIPVTIRDSLVPPLADPGSVLKELQDSMPLPDPPEHPAIVELMGRVVQTWHQLRDCPSTLTIRRQAEYPSLFLLLDLLDWLRIHLPDVFDAITDPNVTLPASSAAQALLTALDAVTIDTSNPTDTVTLTEALAAVENFLPLVQGADVAGPSTRYDLATATIRAAWLEPAKLPDHPAIDSLATFALAALNEVGDPYQVPPELQGMIKADPVAEAGTGQAGKNQAYVIRAVLSHEPCRPVLSAPTQSVRVGPGAGRRRPGPPGAAAAARHQQPAEVRPGRGNRDAAVAAADAGPRHPRPAEGQGSARRSRVAAGDDLLLLAADHLPGAPSS